LDQIIYKKAMSSRVCKCIEKKKWEYADPNALLG